MKKLLLILICLFVSTDVLPWSDRSKGELGQELLEFNYIDELYYKKFSDTPFTGKVNYTDPESGNNVQGKMVNGKMKGTWLGFYRNGKLYQKENYRNGWLHGIAIRYYVFVDTNVALKSRECLYDDGYEKKCTYYWKNQSISSIINYQTAPEHPRGQISLKHGERKRYSEDGSPIEKSIWCKGYELERWTYDSSGNETYEKFDNKNFHPSCK